MFWRISPDHEKVLAGFYAYKETAILLPEALGAAFLLYGLPCSTPHLISVFCVQGHDGGLELAGGGIVSPQHGGTRNRSHARNGEYDGGGGRGTRYHVLCGCKLRVLCTWRLPAEKRCFQQICCILPERSMISLPIWSDPVAAAHSCLGKEFPLHPPYNRRHAF